MTNGLPFWNPSGRIVADPESIHMSEKSAMRRLDPGCSQRNRMRIYTGKCTRTLEMEHWYSGMKTFTVVQRDPKKVTQKHPSPFPGTQEGDLVHEITFTCGHHHWALEAAVECLDRLRGTKLAVNTNIEFSVPDQQNDGEVVEEREIAIARRNLFPK